MKATMLFQAFASSMSDNAAWACALALLLVGIYFVAREVVANAWLGQAISDTALGLCQWMVLVSASTMAVMLLVAFLAVCAIEAYWQYYYPWSLLMT